MANRTRLLGSDVVISDMVDVNGKIMQQLDLSGMIRLCFFRKAIGTRGTTEECLE